jgi:hypothetical protein
VATAAEVEEAHREFAALGPPGGISGLQDVRQQDGRASFQLSDLDRNWWEIAARDEG